MPSKPLELLVGLFVCLGVAAIFLLTYRVASLDNVGSGDTYSVSGLFTDIGGLKVGSAVTLSGVRIGRVSDIKLDPGTYEARVTLAISEDFNELPEDSSAKILTAGLLGEQYIGIEAGGMPDMLTDGSELMLTQSALVLENLIGQFVAGQGKGDDKLADAIGKLADAVGTDKKTESTP